MTESAYFSPYRPDGKLVGDLLLFTVSYELGTLVQFVTSLL